VRALASARPVVASRFAATAKVLSAPGICYPVGGRHVGDADHFEPDVRMVVDGMQSVLAEPAKARDVAMRARGHVRTHLVSGRPRRTATEQCGGRRPLVVLEAPLFETSSSALLTIETARALQRRNRVDLRLRPVAPFSEGLEAFNRRAPSLVPLLSRQPGQADLWLSSGWPPRVSRPDTKRFGVRVDWEYGALPGELSPLVTQSQGADVIVVHSQTVRRTLAAAGCNLDRVELIPHGVDGEVFSEQAPPLKPVLEFKRGRKALLFVGGLIWRKGVDLLLRTVLESYRRDGPICVVIKPMGATGSYSGFSLEELVGRVQEHPDAPEVLLLERTLDSREMAGLYGACDLLVHPYRGEGFGMPALEARACGLPMVTTSGGSTDDFCTGEGCLGVPATRRVVELPGVHIGRPFVLEPDADALGRLVREAVGRLDALRDVARRAAPLVRAEYTWDRAAEHIERMAYAAVTPATVICPAVAPQGTKSTSGTGNVTMVTT
ncbi:MAG: glycosyltransferase family 4 protein, partial [Planctomycetota bacterium]|jgi:glycosyltransferase involved in cell wall biosynthesis